MSADKFRAKWRHSLYFGSVFNKTVIPLEFVRYEMVITPERGGTLRKIGWGCAAHFPKPYPIYDQNS